MKNISPLIVAIILFSTNFASALLQVEINRGNANKLPITLVNCNPASKLSKDIYSIIKNDLNNSSIFEIKEGIGKCTEDGTPEKISDCGSGGMLLSLKIEEDKETKQNLNANLRMIDPVLKKQIMGKSFSATKADHRRLAHTAADSVYTRVSGEKGYFNTKIAYVSENGNTKRLAIMDQDGADNRFLTDGRILVLTPRFSPDNTKLVYMSYLDRMGKVYIKDLTINKDRLISDFSGTIYAPRFTPDGKEIVVARSIDRVTDIYRINVANRKKSKLTVATAINTSPSYSPDQKRIVFNSDRGGAPQLYIMNSDGNQQKRISFGGGSYTNPVWSPRGDLIAFTKRYKGNFYIGLMRPDGGGERIISTGYLVEGPSWSPSGRLLLFTRKEMAVNKATPGASKVYSIDITGKNEQMINTPYNASDPSWSDLL